MALCGTLYICTGVFGYLDFGERVQGSVLRMFKPLDEPQMLISYIGVFSKVTASYGLLGYTFRAVVYDSLGWDSLSTATWKHLLGLSTDPRPETKLVQTGNTAILGIGVFIFSFMCQINVLEIYYEMRPRSVSRFTLCACISMTICGVLYYITGIFGYLDFGSLVESSILLHYKPLDEPQVLLSYIGVFVKICASFGLLNNACRSALFPLVGWNPYTVVYWKYLCGATVLAVLALLLGIFIPNVNTVFNFTGGVCGGGIGFILPALFIMYSGDWSLRTVGFVNYVCTHLLLVGGIVALVFGTSATIYSLV